MDKTPSWGIEPVPERLRVLGLLDTFLLWGNLGISLLVLVLPAYFDLSLDRALLAMVVGGLIGNALLALAGMIGADGRVPTMVLQRAPLGQRGSYIATVLNVLQCLGWAIFELIVIATAAGLLSEKLLGFQGRWLWTLLFGGLATALAFLGPVGFVRRYVRKVAVWAVVASLVYLTWWILDGAGGHSLWSEKGHQGSFWVAVDIVIAVTVSWAPLVADYTRFTRSRKAAFLGVGLGRGTVIDWDNEGMVRRPAQANLLAWLPELRAGRPLDVLFVDGEPGAAPNLDDVVRRDAHV